MELELEFPLAPNSLIRNLGLALAMELVLEFPLAPNSSIQNLGNSFAALAEDI
jgi:hypothetical protein